MPRKPRCELSNHCYHVLNRASGALTLFQNENDFYVFENMLRDAIRRFDVNLFAYCIMPNHWHLVVEPKMERALSKMMHWLTMRHTQRLHKLWGTVGRGHLYQARYKAFLVNTDGHFVTLCRYVERNALAAGIVRRAEEWRWCSLYHRQFISGVQRAKLTEWPMQQPEDWLSMVNEPLLEDEIDRVRASLHRSRPLGDDVWVQKTVSRYHLESTCRSRGRPKRVTNADVSL